MKNDEIKYYTTAVEKFKIDTKQLE